MAETLQLTDGTTTVDFLTGNFYLLNDGWEYENTDELIWDVFTLGCVGSASTIRTEQKKLDDLFEKARIFINDIAKDNPVWLKWQSDGESAKQALVYDGLTRYNARGGRNALLCKTGAYMEVSIMRHPLFEDTSYTTAYSGSGVSGTGGKITLTSPACTAPGRILEVNMQDTGIEEYWIGIREQNEGISGFEPKWEANLGRSSTDTSNVVDGSDTVKQTTFASPSFLRRWDIAWDDIVSADYDHIIGSYLVLLRTRLTDTSTSVRIQMRHGYGAYSGMFDQMEIFGETYLGNWLDAVSAYHLYPIGEVTAPPNPNRTRASSLGSIGNYGFALFAERYSGTGYLNCDCLVLIPSRHMVWWKTGDMTGGCSAGSVFTTEADEQYAEVYALSPTPDHTAYPQYAVRDWVWPAGGTSNRGVMVLAGQANHAHDKTNTLGGGVYVVPRWRTFKT